MHMADMGENIIETHKDHSEDAGIHKR